MINLIKNFFSGIKFIGKYDYWKDAKNNSIGYDNDVFLNKLKSQVLKVIDGEFAYERDTVLFKDKLFSPNFLYTLLLLNDYECNIKDAEIKSNDELIKFARAVKDEEDVEKLKMCE